MPMFQVWIDGREEPVEVDADNVNEAAVSVARLPWARGSDATIVGPTNTATQWNFDAHGGATYLGAVGSGRVPRIMRPAETVAAPSPEVPAATPAAPTPGEVIVGLAALVNADAALLSRGVPIGAPDVPTIAANYKALRAALERAGAFEVKS